MTEIFFTDKQHKRNYEALKVKFKDRMGSGQYRAACYIAAYPEIFKCFSAFKQKNGPFDWYFDYLTNPDDFADRVERGETSGTTAPLTGQTNRLVQFALSCWNGHPCALDDVMDMGEELYLVVLQAIDLVRRRPSIDYNQVAEDYLDMEGLANL